MSDTSQTDAYIIVGHIYSPHYSPVVPASLSRGIKVQRNELLEALDTLTLVVGLTPIAGNKEALQGALDSARKAITKTRRTLNEPLCP